MCSYLLSNENRFYTRLENAYGRVPEITASDRIPAVRLAANQTAERIRRRDKTGGRTFMGHPQGLRRNTSFELQTYLTHWEHPNEPSYGPLFRAAMGGSADVWNGGTIAAVTGDTGIQFVGPHNLSAGQAIVVGDEMRFVRSIVDAQSVEVNAPLSGNVVSGSTATATVTYRLGASLSSASIFDYWSPAEAVQRIIVGAAVNEMKVLVNGDFHEFGFAGAARDIIDSSSFIDGQGELQEFPLEPTGDAYNYDIVPGHLGQAWIGAMAGRLYTLTAASLSLNNGIDLRTREFGSEGARCIVPGRRTVTLDFDLYATADDSVVELYQAARHQSPLQAMFQLGIQAGRMFGAYVKSIVPELPAYDDGESRLQWKFKGAQAQGTADDELIVAFG